MEEPKRIYPNFKSHIILPVIFVLTTLVAIFFIVDDDFIVDLSPIIIWFYFSVVVLYTAVAFLDNFLNKERTKKQKIWIMIMAGLTMIAAALYLVFYILAKGR